jgi:glycosyltransferase involved in cell wall biosynthesis
MVHWLRRLRPDLILTEYDKDLRTVALAARLARIDVRIVHSRECDGPVKDRPWIRAFHNRVADRILVASEATRVSTVESAPWLNPERVHVVPKGIDLTPFEHCLPLEDGPARFGFLGQLVRRKGVSELLEAFLGCDEEMTLSVAGDGPLRPSLEQLVRDRHASSRVRFEGFVRDVPAWLSTIDVLVLPSHAEGWGYVLAEAAAAGRLVLAFAASSVPEVTPASDGAELLDVVAHDRISSLERGIQQLARLEPSERRERGERLRNHARARLGLDRMLDDLDTFFRDTLSTPT